MPDGLQLFAKSRPLQMAKEFPLTGQTLKVSNTLKNDLITASLGVIQDDVSFEVETDASEYAVAAILSQEGRPVACMSRSINI